MLPTTPLPPGSDLEQSAWEPLLLRGADACLHGWGGLLGQSPLSVSNGGDWGRRPPHLSLEDAGEFFYMETGEEITQIPNGREERRKETGQRSSLSSTGVKQTFLHRNTRTGQENLPQQ